MQFPLNVTVTLASPEGQLMEMRDTFLKYLAQQGEYDTYPFGRSVLMDFTSNTMVTLLQMQFVHTLGASSVLFDWKSGWLEFTAAPDMHSPRTRSQSSERYQQAHQVFAMPCPSIWHQNIMNHPFNALQAVSLQAKVIHDSSIKTARTEGEFGFRL